MIAAFPIATPLTVPLSTVATPVSLDVHITDLFVAPAGDTATVKVPFVSGARRRAFLLRDTPVTATDLGPVPEAALSQDAKRDAEKTTVKIINLLFIKTFLCGLFPAARAPLPGVVSTASDGLPLAAKRKQARYAQCARTLLFSMRLNFIFQ
jgi:hypothetical protein